MNALSQLASVHSISPGPKQESLARMGVHAPVGFIGHWEEWLWDLACLDPSWIETAIPGVALAQSVELQGLRVVDAMGVGEGETFRLYCFLDEWYAMHALNSSRFEEPIGFGIEACDGTRLLNLTLDPRANRFALRVLMGIHGTGHRQPIPVRRRTDTAARLARHLQDLASVRDRRPSPLDVGDIAESCGWLTFTPARMRVRGQLRLAASELIPCLLDSVAEQALPVRVMTGTAGVAQSFQGSFNTFRSRHDGWVELSGEEARLRLEPAMIDSAWVLERPGSEGSRHQVRLYDDQGRALLFIEDRPVAGLPESRVWRSLVKALFDSRHRVHRFG